MRVRFTPGAERQYLDVLRFLAERDPAGAATIHRRTEEAVEVLREHRFAGHAIPEFADVPHRELSVTPYRLFYRVVDDTIWIVAYWHARQQPERPAET